MTQEENGGHGQPSRPGEARAVLYLRVGSAHPQDGQAAVLQRTACLRFAESHGLSIVREYVDLGTPARYDCQSALQHLLFELDEKRDAPYVVVSDYARLSRMLPELTSITRRVHSCRAVIATVNNTNNAGEGGTSHEV
ncbi:DNA invertase Pin-like site-specific DNA recombinase [Catenulispora sp. GAS73]|uniref:recombinase family protein n=1 Tax=Catenulispora sp. GAS73 TaxID=3156269 RepID=UPI003512CB84